MVLPSARFLHIADIHLGFDRYDSPERTKDFFFTFRDVLQQYALEPAVDFVAIAGDLFEHRTILPNVLNQAELALKPLREAGIPVLAIEGNHDNRPYGTHTSWLRYLAERDFLILLEPQPGETGEFLLAPWSEQQRSGSYLDLPCGVRVIGSRWYGSVAPAAIAHLAEAIANLPPGPDTTVLMFHHGLEGQIARYAGALRYRDILPLREAGVDYLALGHIHKNYELDGWVFNPGSLLPNTAAEFSLERGAYVVEVEDRKISAELKSDYHQRPCVRLRCETIGTETAEQVAERILDKVAKANIDRRQQAIVELKLVGQLGFERYELNVKELKQRIQLMANALIVLLKVEAEAVQYDIAPNAIATDERLAIETQVFSDLLAQHAHYRRRSGELSKVLLRVKDLMGDGEPEERLYDYLEKGLAGDLPDD
ncbi:DNA repair exonuclease [Synechococcus sp. PCC 7336]|uniref:metallophosphoesterase family protein n=1 Tax=Synechococcus sp. PCC 7336 TaxID=195250 RepID=UPI0003690007|nr:DNA repair exonuclease [Synechococcus sp. PCC 7336]